MNKALSATILSATVLLGAMASTSVFARGGFAHHGHHFRGGFGHHHGHHFRGGFGHHHGHHFRGGVGVFIGAPAFYGAGYYAPYYGYAPYYDYGPYYGYAPAVVGPSSPPEYVEQGEAAPPARQSERYRQSERHHWYYCAESKSYYPYVDRCAGPWQRVAPEPPQS